MYLRRIAFAATLILSIPALSFAGDTTSTWQKNLETWRAQHAAELQAPDSWLSVVGLDWLDQGTNTVGAADDNSAQVAGLGVDHLFLLRRQEGHIRLEPTAQGFPEGLTVNGKAAVARELALGREPDLIRYGTFSFVVIARGDGFGLRVRNSNSEERVHFRGLHWYKPDPAYRVTAQWVPYAQTRKVTVQSVVNTTTEGVIAGEVRFQLHGQQVTLVPVLQSLEDHSLFFVLRDATSKTTTYQASRFLHTDLPDHGLRNPGTVELDLNKLVNPPCAFTAHATCPLPIEQNRLAVAIEAGEQRYEHAAE